MADNHYGRDKVVLVVDDYALTRAMVQSILRNIGFSEVLQAESGDHAISRLEDNKVDIVICDWNMPGTSGIDVLRYMRNKPQYAKVPFIMLTAEVYRKNVEEAIAAGVTDYISKPFTPDTLVGKLNKLFS